MATEKTIRTDSHWMKITRDSKARTFTFAMGYQGDFKAHEIKKYSFSFMPTWTDAEEHAKTHMAVFN